MFMVGMDSTIVPHTTAKCCCLTLGMVEIETMKIYEDKYKNLSFLYKQSDAII